MQGDDPRYLKTVATAKHYAVHSGPESQRHVFDAQVSESDLRDTYLPAFRTLVVDAKAESVMCAYNAFRGLPACGSDELLGKILRGEWGFSGYVVSDCAAVIDIHLSHKARKTAAEGAAMALLAGTDLECGAGSWAPGAPDSFAALGDAVGQGLVKEADVDRALRRLLRAQLRLGVFDPPERLPWAKYTYQTVVDSALHRQLALEAARKAIVLLKNEGGTLPLAKGLGDGRRDRAEGGRHRGARRELQRHADRAGLHPRGHRGRGRSRDEGRVRAWRAARHGPGRPRDRAGRRRSSTREREPGPARRVLRRSPSRDRPVFSRVDPRVDFDWADGAPQAGMNDDAFSVRWTGLLQAPATGRYTLAMRCATVLPDPARRQAGRPGPRGPRAGDDRRRRRAPRRALVPDPPRAGAREVRCPRAAPLGDAQGRRDELGAAVAAAQEADAVVLVLGLSSRLEGEEMPVKIEGFAGGDRTSLDLPAVQQALMEQVVAAAQGQARRARAAQRERARGQLGRRARAGDRRGLVSRVRRPAPPWPTSCSGR